MDGSADSNLVLAASNVRDALHARALAHLRKSGRLRVPLSVGIELLQVAFKKGWPALDILAHAARDFHVDDSDLLTIAAQAMDRGDVATPMDAVHLAGAFLRSEPLHTADRRLQKSHFPTVAW